MVSTENLTNKYVGLVGDDKPIDGVSNGSTFLEIDSEAFFIFDEEDGEWIRQDTGNINPTGTISITANATDIDVASYATADVDVPNTYEAGDEGKVVDDGALVAQTSKTITSNNTYDTTTNNEVVVAVPLPSGSTSVSYTEDGEYTVDVTDYESITITVAVTNDEEVQDTDPPETPES